DPSPLSSGTTRRSSSVRGATSTASRRWRGPATCFTTSARHRRRSRSKRSPRATPISWLCCRTALCRPGTPCVPNGAAVARCAVLAFLVGGALGVSGVGLQALVRNPLADPFLLGLSGGAGLGAVVAIAFHLPGPWALPLAAFVGAVGAMALVYRLGLMSGAELDPRILLLGGVAVGAFAAAVAVAGVIGFVGLIVPHVCRLLWGRLHRTLFPTAFLAGGVLLAAADTLARTVVAPRELPVGIVTALLGVPLFAFLLRRWTVS